VQEDTSRWVGWLRLHDRGPGWHPYFYPHAGRLLLTYLPRWAAVQRSGVEVEEVLT
jgi:hypothetical protein